MAHELELEWWRPQIAEAPEAMHAAVRPESEPASLSFWFMMVFTGIVLFSPQTYFPILASVRPGLLVMVLAGLSYFVYRWIRGLPVIEWNRESTYIAGLAALAVMTLPFAIWPGGSLASLVEYLKTVVVFLLLSHVITTVGLLRRASWVLTFMALGLGLFYLYNFTAGAFVDKGDNSDRLIGNEGGLTKNPNDMALMVNLLLPLTVGLFLASKRAWQRVLLFFAICMEAGTVILTYSRGGALTLAAIVVLYIWKLRGRAERSLLYAVLLAGVLALPLLPSSYFDRMSTITSMADRTGSAGERLSDLIIAVKTVVSHPVLGAGMGMNVLAMREVRGEWRGVHNVYLEHAIDLGLPGLVLFLALLLSCIQAVSRIQRLNVSPELSYLAQGIQVSLLAYAVAAMFHPVSYHYYFYYIAGLAVAARSLAMLQSDHESEART